ncbi:hypothetical protein [Methyloglobulus sp.]|uniref:hypothetical protein n=1 Tax=Methyloglobulus sp. TaxID=2518622 RepID=UPI0032B7EC65
MKKVLVALGLAISAFSFQASAATFNSYDLGAITDFKGFNGEFRGTGPFEDTYIFVAPANDGISASATNSFTINAKTGKTIGKINNFAAQLDGVDLLLSSGGTFQLLMADLAGTAEQFHSLVISGTSTGSYGGSIAVAQTPIPAAIWLFGSALMGLTGVSRRKAAKG